MTAFFENILIMILTVALLIGGAYLALVLLNFALKFKGGLREDERLVDLWAEVHKKQGASDQSSDITDGGPP
jgi:hypothetical protein